MNRIGKSLQNAGKHLSVRTKQKIQEKKPVKLHKIPIKFVQPNIPVKEQGLTKMMKEEIAQEFEKLSDKVKFLTPDKMIQNIDFTFESFFAKREMDLKNFNKLIQVLSQQGMIDEALGVVEKMKLLSVTPDNFTYVGLIVACAKVRDLETAEVVFSKAVSQLGATATLYTSLISAYSFRVEPDQVLRLINEKRDKGFKIHESDYSCYMQALIKSGKSKEAIEVYEKHAHEVDTDEYLLATVLTACSKISATEYAVGIWDRLKGVGFAQVAYFYNEMIMCYAKRKDYAQKAIELYKQMRGEGVIPNHRTFTGLFTACGRLGDLPEARLGLKEMKLFGLEPCKTHLSQLMNIYAEATLDANEDAKDLFVKESWELFKICQEKGMVDVSVLNSLLDVHTKGGFENQVEGIVLPLYDQLGIKRDVYTYRKIMGMYGELGEFKTVKQLWLSMVSEKIEPDMYVLNYYLKACMKTGDTDQCCTALSKFKDLGLRPLYIYLKQLHRTDGLPMRLWAHLQDFEFYNTKDFNKKYSDRLRSEKAERRYTK